MTAGELQARLDARGEVIGDGRLELSAPLRIGSDTRLRWHGTLIAPPGQPAITCRTDEHPHFWSITGPRLVGGGIYLPPSTPTYFPGNFHIEHVTIEGVDGWAVDDDNSAAWQCGLRDVRAMNCGRGFRIHGGTTRSLRNLHASGAGCKRAYEIVGTNSTEMAQCSFDHHDDSEPLALFWGNTGLVQTNLHFEGNTARGTSLVKYEGNTGLVIRHALSWRSRLVTNRTAVYLFEFAANIGTVEGLAAGVRGLPVEDLCEVTDGRGYAVSVVCHGAERNRLQFRGCQLSRVRDGIYAVVNVGAKRGAAIEMGPTNAVEWVAVYDQFSEIRRAT